MVWVNLSLEASKCRRYGVVWVNLSLFASKCFRSGVLSFCYVVGGDLVKFADWLEEDKRLMPRGKTIIELTNPNISHTTTHKIRLSP